ncbi:MAG: 50S ribosomal protein L11 methyltransferase, partial [Prolixibacteraceae bacterium]|nr:50S ribosomal protein L11 methyltransferase [Prolixibacteraceae bacterium]
IWQDEYGLRAYFEGAEIDSTFLKELSSKYGSEKALTYTVQLTNSLEWDKVKAFDFEPILIANEIAIVSATSNFNSSTKYTIILNDQMAFGSGEHPSTALCLEVMLNIDFKNKKVVDVGTGTAVLAVLAEKMGALEVKAFDNNPWAIEVASKTINKNNSENIDLTLSEIESFLNFGSKFDIVLANLNFMVFRDEFENVMRLNSRTGLLLVSGIMIKDKDYIINKASFNNYKLKKVLQKSEWIAMLFEQK